MTTAIRSIERTEQAGGVRRIAGALAGALGGLHERVVAWSGPYYGGQRYEGDDLPLDQRLDAALRWQSDRGRTV